MSETSTIRVNVHEDDAKEFLLTAGWKIHEDDGRLREATSPTNRRMYADLALEEAIHEIATSIRES